ncbi:zinc dependent phospholipase C family protein [bacterium]|nr:zinc dependent phospholipase C family protein [candidate division CSSED10-310 bacterium]
MPGFRTHLYSAHVYLESGQTLVQPHVSNCFILGTIFPDAGYWPGNRGQFSDRVHYVGAARFPKVMYDAATTAEWKAFALGWLLHVHLDIQGHPFINRLVAAASGRPGHEKPYEEDAIMHARVESGLDLALILDHGFTHPPDWKIPESAEFPLGIAWETSYAETITRETMESMTRRMAISMRLLERMQRIVNRRPVIAERVIDPLERLFGRPFQWISALLNPPIPSADVMTLYLNTIHHVVSSWCCDGHPGWFSYDVNLDTGHRSRRGEYRLADATYCALSRRMHRDALSIRYPESVDAILENWEWITREFNAEDAVNDTLGG